MAHFLKERGLELSHEKTQITHVEEGFDFLGQNVRRYRCGKVLTKPSAANVKTFLTKIRETIDELGQPDGRRNDPAFESADQGLDHVPPLCREQTHLYATWIIGSSRWCGGGAGDGTRTRIGSGSRRNTSGETVTATGSSPGLLRDQKGQGWPIQLMAAASVKIIRYVKIRSAVNPYDPEWELYLEARWGWQLAQTRTGRSRIEFLWKVQEGRCVVCGQPLRIADGRLPHPPSDLAQPKAVRTRRTTWSCCMPTVIGRSTCKNDGRKQPRPARGVREGLSCMTGNCHVQF